MGVHADVLGAIELGFRGRAVVACTAFFTSDVYHGLQLSVLQRDERIAFALYNIDGAILGHAGGPRAVEGSGQSLGACLRNPSLAVPGNGLDTVRAEVDAANT